MVKYKDFSQSRVLSFDIECKDPDLKTLGPSVRRGGGYILGVSLADDTGFAEYYNIGHDDYDTSITKYNIDFLREALATHTPKVGHNILYDLDWLCNSFHNYTVNGRWLDTQQAETLINENQFKYNLDHISEKYLNKHKAKSKIEVFCERNNLKGDPRQWLYLMPYDVVREYAIEDVLLPIEIIKRQWQIMKTEELIPVFEMEMSVYPMYVAMRGKGVRVDEKKLDVVDNYICDKLVKNEEKLFDIAGDEINYNSGMQLAPILDKFGIAYETTPKTKKPSITKPWLKSLSGQHEIIDLILECRKYNTVKTKFLDSQLKHSIVKGRIHTLIHPCKIETDNGTVTGRASSSMPNLQNQPNAETEAGALIRGLFLPEDGEYWGRADYSQIELRIFAHYAMGKGSEELREAYRLDRKFDLHQWCADLAGLPGSTGRKQAKTINFGLLYGMGLAKLCAGLGLSFEDGKRFLSSYHSRFPFMKATTKAAQSKGERVGYVRTLMGRRRRFEDRAYCYKAFNAVDQGTAADIMKKSMADTWESGIYEVLTPLLVVHDELDVSVPLTKEGEEAFKEMLYMMENTIMLKVPLLVEAEKGPTWGELEAV